MISKIKKILYFPLAHYFRFFAQIQLAIWHPKIIVITGSSAKTTLLHMLESQIGKGAKYSHQANSSFGIPFDILDLKRKTLKLLEWPALFLLAPVRAFQKLHSQNLYIVEADCDRPHEGKFLATLLHPEFSCWLVSSRSHSINFPEPVDENIAHEFGYFLEWTSKRVIVNGDSPLIKRELQRTTAEIETISQKDLQSYQVTEDQSIFKIKGKGYTFNFLLPQESFYQIQSVIKILDYLNIPLDPLFKNFTLPPSRSSLLKGIKNTLILDSSYNADLNATVVMLNMFKKVPALHKWVILGDLVEQGKKEQEEHQRLVPAVLTANPEKVILVGPRLKKYTYPLLKGKIEVENFITPLEALNYIKASIRGEEMIFFKGARFLEGIIEHLLKNKADAAKLCRREKVWQERRKRWGL
ncbi:hypothetical protein HYZ06_02605 [Candidatus Daviesbacteria bacterium]|nr:hypothetical protein [Candidatus Daviesbacteria bacterium]